MNIIATASTNSNVISSLRTPFQCSICGCLIEESRCKRGDQTICYVCATGRETEEHHLFGRDHDLTIITPSNVHRYVTARMMKWPAALRDPRGHPILEIARAVRIAADFAACIAEHPECIAGWVLDGIRELAPLIARHAERASDWLAALYHLLQDLKVDYWQALAPLVRGCHGLQ